jgi:adenylate cyclase
MAVTLELQLLGGFGAATPAGRAFDIVSKKNRALLAYLALASAGLVPRDRLVALLWSDRDDEHARNSLRQALVALRRDLNGVGPSPLIVADDTVALDPSHVRVDAVEFARLAAGGGVQALREAMALYRGDLLDGLAIRDPAFEEWIAPERERLRDLAIATLERLWLQETGEQRIAVAKRLLGLDPLREAAHRALMQAYAEQGNAAVALRQYEACRDLLRRELDVAPATETEELRRKILQNEVKPAESAAPPHESLALPDKPSIAVLPFANISGDPEQEYFADGITEDIIIDLSKVSTLNVLSRNTTFTFKGKAVEIGQIAQRLKVGYVVEGSVRKAGGRVRITAQLIDASKDSHIWGERYDRHLNDIFALQDEIAQTIVAALKIRLLPEEKEAIEHRSTHDPKAYQLYLLARFYQTQYNSRTLKIALEFCRRALKIDPDYARVWALAAICEAFLLIRGASEESGLSAAERALSLDPTLAEAYAAKGLALTQLGESALAIAAHEKSLRLAADSYDVRAYFAQTNMQLGNYEAAIEHYERAAQLLEADYACISLSAACHRALGHHEECTSTARRALVRIEREIALRPDNLHAMVMGAIELGYLGEMERAKEWALRALAIESDDMQDSYDLSCALIQLDEPEQALNRLEKYAERIPPGRLAWVKRDADLEPLRSHPRYKALIARAEARYSAFLAEKAARTERDLS